MPNTKVSLLTLFLIILLLLNIYFFRVISVDSEVDSSFFREVIIPDYYKEINYYLVHLPISYKSKNPEYFALQRKLVKSYNVSNYESIDQVWKEVTMWSENESLFPDEGVTPGQVLRALQNAKVVRADNAMKGTQLKLLLTLQGNQQIFFKPKRYNLDDVIEGHIYAGFDRHNAEIFGYYLAIVLNMKWVAPAIIRKLDVKNEIWAKAHEGLRDTMISKGDGRLCIYGHCYYCRPNETVCADSDGKLEGAAILLIDKQFKIYKSPWRRSYTSRNMEWQTDDKYCQKLKLHYDKERLLHLIDTSIFDFLIQNGDRHRYELYKDKLILLDNGKGLGNPYVDAMDILAPLYQCCMIRSSTWKQLELLSGGALTDTIKTLAALQLEQIATYDHYTGVERRLLKVYATVLMCIGKYGGHKVLQ